MLVAFGYRAGETNAICPICNNEIGKPFTDTSANSSETVTDNDLVSLDVAHIDARSKSGSMEVSNTFPAHKICNLTNTVWSLEYFCSKWTSKTSAATIKEKALEAQRMADDMILRGMVYPQAYRCAAAILRESKDYQRRVPESLQSKILAA
jgi:hypothetical protein